MVMPLLFRFEGEGRFGPASPYHARKADEHYVIGELYPLEESYGRSQASHGHQFAWLHEAWMSLPERFKAEPWAQTSEHLRKYALIRTGYCDTTTFACGSRAEAERWAKNLRPFDEYSIVAIEGTTVQRFTAQSQSMRAMGGKRFNASKAAILDFIAGLIGVEPQALASQGDRAA
jgi:hypothetical protein